MMVCSSAVTTRPVFSAAATIEATSSGLSVGTCRMWALMPSACSASAASTARPSMMPVVMTVTSPPSRTTTAGPILNS